MRWMLLFAGDPHGNFKPMIKAALKLKPDAVITLGDHDLERPLSQELKPLLAAGIRVLWIPGNHDGDRDHWYGNLFGGIPGLWNLHGHVIEVGGLRIAGLGGVFRQQVWFPPDKPKLRTRMEMLHFGSNYGDHLKWKAPGEVMPGLPRRYRVTIFPEDFDRLASECADILVSHEAPSCHKHGFSEIDALADIMGVKMIIHGHHHEDYEAVLDSGVRVLGVGLGMVKAIDSL